MSLRNAAKEAQRLHRERQQPSERAHLGHLQKKKDYKLRARDNEEKRKQLKALHKKALDKNPDEFYFHMVNAKLEGGIHQDLPKVDEEAMTKAEKTSLAKNIKYLDYKLQLERKKIDKLKADLHIVEDGAVQRKHIVFVDSTAEASSFDPAAYFETEKSLVGRPFNRPRRDRLEGRAVRSDSEIEKRATREKEKKMTELTKRIQREKEISIALDKLRVSREYQNCSKNENPTLETEGSPTSAPVYKFAPFRKR